MYKSMGPEKQQVGKSLTLKHPFWGKQNLREALCCLVPLNKNVYVLFYHKLLLDKKKNTKWPIYKKSQPKIPPQTAIPSAHIEAVSGTIVIV